MVGKLCGYFACVLILSLLKLLLLDGAFKWPEVLMRCPTFYVFVFNFRKPGVRLQSDLHGSCWEGIMAWLGLLQGRLSWFSSRGLGFSLNFLQL